MNSLLTPSSTTLVLRMASLMKHILYLLKNLLSTSSAYVNRAFGLHIGSAGIAVLGVLVLQLGQQVRDDTGRRSQEQVVGAVVDVSLVHLDVCVELVGHWLCEVHERRGVAGRAAE